MILSQTLKNIICKNLIENWFRAEKDFDKIIVWIKNGFWFENVSIFIIFWKTVIFCGSKVFIKYEWELIGGSFLSFDTKSRC